MYKNLVCFFSFFFSSRRRHTRSLCDWSSDVCSSDLKPATDHRRPSGAFDGRGLRRLVDSTPPKHTSDVGGGGAERTAGGRSCTAEIGRASCRERVEIVGVAVALEKKR